MDRSRLPLPAAIALLVSLVISTTGVPHAAAQEGGEPVQGEDWSLERRLEPGEGFTMRSRGTVDGQPARIERTFDLADHELRVRYALGNADDPEREVEASVAIAGVYLFEDDGDGRLDVSDRVVDHRRVDPDAEAYVAPVSSTSPLSSARAVVPLEETGGVVVTLTATSELALVRGAQLTPAESRANVTVTDLSVGEERHVALALDARAPSIADTDDALARLDGRGAGVVLDWEGALDEGSASMGASVLEERREGGERALVLLGAPGSPTVGHDVGTEVVHTSSGFPDVADAVRGEPGPFLLGLAAATILVGATASRKLRSGR